VTLAYVAGPITEGHGRTVADNVRVAVGAHLALVRAGVASVCPHLNALAPGAFDVPYEAWLDSDLETIRRCDAVLLLPNWEQSKGATAERHFAMLLEKRLYYDAADLIAAEAGR
jgi:hypothetical protein